MIAVPITGKITVEALGQIERANELADIIELRIDCIKDLDAENLKRLIKKARKKIIVTNRPKREGGFFTGSEKERIALLKKAFELGADYIDVEFSTEKKYISSLSKLRGHGKIILSYHDFKETPPLKKLIEIFGKMSKVKKAYVFKIVTTAKFHSDIFESLKLIQYAKKKHKKIISFCMGELGRDSRILCVPLGAFLTFASLEEGKESADGQLPVRKMRETYRGLSVMI